MWIGAASALVPKGFCGAGGCPTSLAWAIRWCPATNRLAGSSMPDRTSTDRIGETVFVPGARCFGDVRGLFGGSAARVVVASQRAPTIHDHLGREGVLLALAATAYHALAAT
jgi:hypothetical protein